MEADEFKLTFDQFKAQVFKIARRYNRVYLLPGNDDLRVLFENGHNPEQVIGIYFKGNKSANLRD